MAKRKTKRQKQAAKRRSYIRSEYYKTFDALSFISEHIKQIPIKIPKKITKASLKAIRNLYNKVKKQVQHEGYVLPTKSQMAKQVRSEPTQQYRRYRAEPTEAPQDFQPDTTYLDDIRTLLDQLVPMKPADHTETYYQDKIVPQVEEAKQRILGAIDYARMKVGDAEIAQILAANDFIVRIANIEEKYAYEIIEGIDDDLIPLIESSVGEALDGV